MFTEFQFPYGDSALTARIPTRNIAFALQRKHAPGLPDEYAALLSAIRAPIDSPPLRECVGSRDQVVVIVTDNTRACPDDRLCLLCRPAAVTSLRGLNRCISGL